MSAYFGLIVFAGIGVLVLAVVLTSWRVRRGWTRLGAAWRSLVESALLGSLVGIAALTVSTGPGLGGPGMVNLVPFRALLDNIALGDFYVRLVLFDLAANFALYLPLGLLVALRFPALRAAAWIVAVVGVAIGIEVAQGTVLNRSADVTDVLTNSAGGIAGFLIGRALQRFLARRAPAPAG